MISILGESRKATRCMTKNLNTDKRLYRAYMQNTWSFIFHHTILNACINDAQANNKGFQENNKITTYRDFFFLPSA